MENNINILSLVLATLVPMAMGMLWYSKALFGKAWMASIGMTDEKMKSANMPVMMVVSILMAFLMSFFLLQFNNGPGQEGIYDSFRHGAIHGIVLGVFLAIPLFISNGLFEHKTWTNMLINGFFWLVCFAIMGGILDAMNHWTH